MPDTNPTPKVVIKELALKIQTDLLTLKKLAVNYALDHGLVVTDAISERHGDAVIVVKEIVDLITEKRPKAKADPAPAQATLNPLPEEAKS